MRQIFHAWAKTQEKEYVQEMEENWWMDAELYWEKFLKRTNQKILIISIWILVILTFVIITD